MTNIIFSMHIICDESCDRTGGYVETASMGPVWKQESPLTLYPDGDANRTARNVFTPRARLVEVSRHTADPQKGIRCALYIGMGIF